MQLQLKEAIEELRPASILFNFEDLKKEITESLYKYKNIVYTEEQISIEAKKDRAMLNQLIDQIDNERKRVANIYKEPLVRFESDIKSIITLINDAKNAIDNQIKEVELKNKEEKRLLIEGYYNSIVKKVKAILPFEKVLKAEWLNKTYSMKSIKEEILKKIEKTTLEYEMINNFKACDVERLKQVYVDTLDIGVVLGAKAKEEELKKRVDEYEDIKKPVADKVEKIRLIVEGTFEQFLKLKSFLDTNNIKYSKEL